MAVAVDTASDAHPDLNVHVQELERQHARLSQLPQDALRAALIV